MQISRYLSTIGTFDKQVRMKFKLPVYDHLKDKDLPMFMFGYYLRDDQEMAKWVLNHRGFLVIVWSGSDSMNLEKKKRAIEYFKDNKDRIKHVAWSHWIVSDLEAVGLEVVKRAVFPVTFDWLRFEKEHSGKVYHYHARHKSRYEFYGTDIVNKIEKKGLLNGQFVKTCWGHVKPQSREMYGLYRLCYIGIRLTEHDNMALSAVEMGLMGRKTIFNGNIPCAINYESKYEAVRMLIESFKNKPEPDKLLAEEMREFVHDDMAWLNTNYYE